jgi:hypothetical protein
VVGGGGGGSGCRLATGSGHMQLQMEAGVHMGDHYMRGEGAVLWWAVFSAL